jgi:transcriptional regulator with XRE-family HTH domain
MSEFFLATNGGKLSQENLDNQRKLISNLKINRLASGISLEQAAHTLGVSADLLDAVEGFRVDLSMTDLRQYAYACNAVIEYEVK